MLPHNFVIALFILVFLISGCSRGHEDMLRAFDQLETSHTENYPLAYAYCTYLSTSTKITPEQALPLIVELIGWEYHSEARYCIENLEDQDIKSGELLALKGLCLYNELQPELAMEILESLRAEDPSNDRINEIFYLIVQNRELENQDFDSHSAGSLERASALISRKEYARAEELLNTVLGEDGTNHKALFYKGIIRLELARYDSAIYYFSFARSSENIAEYATWTGRTKAVIAADEAINDKPLAYQGYLSKGQNLAAMGLFEAAQYSLSQGLEQIPGNMNLILAKALVWVQAGEADRARQYFQELEQGGIYIDPALRDKILNQTQEQGKK